MTKDEWRMTKGARMAKPALYLEAFALLRHPFDIRHPAFVIHSLSTFAL
jgi:hypothetical protein